MGIVGGGGGGGGAQGSERPQDVNKDTIGRERVEIDGCIVGLKIGKSWW